MNILKKTICGAFLLGFSLSSYADERCYVSEVMSGVLRKSESKRMIVKVTLASKMKQYQLKLHWMV